MAKNVCPSVQPVAWPLEMVQLPEALRCVDVLHMPEPMFKSLADLKSPESESPPLVSLHDLLGSLSSSIIGFEPWFLRAENTARLWLYTPNSDQIDKQRLRTLITTWLIATYGEGRAASLVASWDTLHWNHTRIDLATAPFDVQQRLFPGLLTRWLLKQKHELVLQSDAGPQTMLLRLVPLMSNRQFADLMTEPQPLKGQQVSFVMRFWMDILPETRQPVLYARTSVRRWMDGSLIRDNNQISMRRNRTRSVYLRRHTGYLDRQPRQDVFSRISLRYSGGGAQGLRWVGNQAHVFAQSDIGATVPAPDAFIQDLTAHQDQLLIPLEARDSRHSRVTGGLKIRDHLDIASALTRRFAPFASPLPLQGRCEVGDSKRLPAQRERKYVPTAVRLEALRSLPAGIRLELHTPEIRRVKQVIFQAIGYEVPDDAIHEHAETIADERGRPLLEILPRFDETLIDELPASVETVSWKTRQTIEERCQKAITVRYPWPQQPTAALIMLHDYREGNWRRDPKGVIRRGLAHAGRITKFYTPLKTNESEKAAQSRLDNTVAAALRTLGYRWTPYYVRPSAASLPEHLDLMAFWIFQRNARKPGEKTRLLPVAVVAHSGSHQLEVYLPGPTGQAARYPSLSDALVASARTETDFEQSAQAVQFFRSAVSQYQSPHPALLILSEQNIRRVFPELNAPFQTELTLGGLMSTRPMRVAQLRFSRYAEAPFCVPGAQQGKYQGLYGSTQTPHVFYSLHNLNPALSKPSIMHRKLDMANHLTLNPSTLQIWVRGLQEGDQAADWAALIHRLRLQSSHTDTATLYPQPLHDLQLFYKYISRLTDDTQSADAPHEPDEEV